MEIFLPLLIPGPSLLLSAMGIDAARQPDR
jgi:hypothetical protein